MLEEYASPVRCLYPEGGSKVAETRLDHWLKEIAPIDAALEGAPARQKKLKQDARQALNTLMRVHSRLWAARRRSARWVRWAYATRPLPHYLWFYKRGHLWWMT